MKHLKPAIPAILVTKIFRIVNSHCTIDFTLVILHAMAGISMPLSGRTLLDAATAVKPER
jgi:hypothetical protein